MIIVLPATCFYTVRHEFVHAVKMYRQFRLEVHVQARMRGMHSRKHGMHSRKHRSKHEPLSAHMEEGLARETSIAPSSSETIRAFIVLKNFCTVYTNRMPC